MSCLATWPTHGPCSRRFWKCRRAGPREGIGPDGKRVGSVFDEADVAGARSLLGILRREFDALTFAKQLEHRTAHRAAVKEVLNSAFVADEAEALIDQKSCNCAGRHTRGPPYRPPGKIPRDSAGYRRH